MNLKTSLAILTLCTAPIRGVAQKASNSTKPQVIKTVLNDTIGTECSNLISYKDFVYPNSYYINTDSVKTVNHSLKKTVANGKIWAKPAAFRKPKPEMAYAEVVNADKTKFEYDKFGNINAIYSRQGHKTRTITRDPKGNLCEYVNISYKNGKKSTEEVFNDEGKLVEKRKFHGNKRATVTNYDNNGNTQFEGYYKTEIIDGEEVVPGEHGYYFE